MPFDSAGFPPDPSPGSPRRRRRADPGAILVAVLSALLLGMPFSLAACSDILRALRGH